MGEDLPLLPEPGPSEEDGRGPIGFVDGSPEEEPACDVQVLPTAARLPVIQFVVDTSGSMNWAPGTEDEPPPGELSKWQITQAALGAAIDAMPDGASVGLVYYPNINGDPAQCFLPEVAAPIARLSSQHRDLIREKINAQVAVGGTPTHAAYDFGVTQLDGSSLDGERFLVLMTDGIPTFTRECGGNGRDRVDATPLIEDVGARLGQSSIRTFVIGSPGSEEAREELSEMALVGGTNPPDCGQGGAEYCHFDMTTAPDFSTALGTALGEIADATLTCSYSVPTPPGRFSLDLQQVSVVIESNGTTLQEFAPALSAECDAGWQYSSDKKTIQLCQSTCDELGEQLRGDPSIAVRVKVGCNVVPQ